LITGLFDYSVQAASGVVIKDAIEGLSFIRQEGASDIYGTAPVRREREGAPARQERKR